MLDKTQREVFLVNPLLMKIVITLEVVFLVNPLLMKIVITLEVVAILT